MIYLHNLLWELSKTYLRVLNCSSWNFPNIWNKMFRQFQSACTSCYYLKFNPISFSAIFLESWINFGHQNILFLDHIGKCGGCVDPDNGMLNLRQIIENSCKNFVYRRAVHLQAVDFTWRRVVSLFYILSFLFIGKLFVVPTTLHDKLLTDNLWCLILHWTVSTEFLYRKQQIISKYCNLWIIIL